jgi:hypothetical protein
VALEISRSNQTFTEGMHSSENVVYADAALVKKEKKKTIRRCVLKKNGGRKQDSFVQRKSRCEGSTTYKLGRGKQNMELHFLGRTSKAHI